MLRFASSGRWLRRPPAASRFPGWVFHPLALPVGLRGWCGASGRNILFTVGKVEAFQLHLSGLSAGVQDRWLGARWRNPSGGPNRETLSWRQLNGLWQDQWLLPGAIPRQWHSELLGHRTVKGQNDPGEEAKACRWECAQHSWVLEEPVGGCVALGKSQV